MCVCSCVQTVFAVYGETNRLKTKVDHPNGEDFLVTKIAQLTWLFEGIPASHGSWDIHIVDDGRPDGSGAVRATLEPTWPLCKHMSRAAQEWRVCWEYLLHTHTHTCTHRHRDTYTPSNRVM